VPLQIMEIGQIVPGRYFWMRGEELAAEIVGSSAEEQSGQRSAAAPASILAHGVLRTERARGKQCVKFLFVHGGFPQQSNTDVQRKRPSLPPKLAALGLGKVNVVGIGTD
jgi:hypothetical protein